MMIRIGFEDCPQTVLYAIAMSSQSGNISAGVACGFAQALIFCLLQIAELWNEVGRGRGADGVGDTPAPRPPPPADDAENLPSNGVCTQKYLDGLMIYPIHTCTHVYSHIYILTHKYIQSRFYNWWSLTMEMLSMKEP